MLKTVLVTYVVLVASVFLFSALWNFLAEKLGLRMFKKRGNPDEKTD